MKQEEVKQEEQKQVMSYDQVTRRHCAGDMFSTEFGLHAGDKNIKIEIKCSYDYKPKVIIEGECFDCMKNFDDLE